MDAVGESLDAGRDPEAKVRADVDVDEPGSERRRVPEVVREERRPSVRRTPDRDPARLTR